MKFWPFRLQKKMTINDVLRALDNGSGGSVRITPEQALGVSAVFAACRVISEDVAKLPAHLKERSDSGGKIANGAPENRILSSIGKPVSDVDDGFTAMEWIEAITHAAALQGRGVAHLNRVGGRAREVTPIARDKWRHERGVWAIQWTPGKWEPVDRADLMVLRGPQLGTNVTKWASQVISLAIHIDRLLLSLARKSGRPNAIVSMDDLTPEKAETLVDRFKKTFGSNGEGGMIPLDVTNLKFHKVSLTPEELQLDETSRSVVNRIASAFRVQPARLMEQMGEQNHASAYQWNIAHVSDTVMPWALRFKQSFDKDVLGPELATRFYCDLELKGLLRGAPKERADFLLKLRTMCAASPKQVAELEDLPTEGLSDDPAHPLLTNPNPAAAEEGKTDDD